MQYEFQSMMLKLYKLKAIAQDVAQRQLSHLQLLLHLEGAAVF